jgi:hypothetical protein
MPSPERACSKEHLREVANGNDYCQITETSPDFDNLIFCIYPRLPRAVGNSLDGLVAQVKLWEYAAGIIGRQRQVGRLDCLDGDKQVSILFQIEPSEGFDHAFLVDSFNSQSWQ